MSKEIIEKRQELNKRIAELIEERDKLDCPHKLVFEFCDCNPGKEPELDYFCPACCRHMTKDEAYSRKDSRVITLISPIVRGFMDYNSMSEIVAESSEFYYNPAINAEKIRLSMQEALDNRTRARNLSKRIANDKNNK